jgi:hypothetical protein
VLVRIDLWEGMATSQPVPGDTMVLAGCVMITNPGHPTGLNSANLVYEQVGDRLSWQIYKFRSGLVPPDKYRYGPYRRTHGLRHGEFFDPRERHFMLHPVMHVWSKTVTPLTAETSAAVRTAGCSLSVTGHFWHRGARQIAPKISRHLTAKVTGRRHAAGPDFPALSLIARRVVGACQTE